MQPLLDRLGREPEGERGAGRTRCVLGVVHAAQRADAADAGDGARGAAGGQHDLLRLHIEPVGQRPPHRDADEPLARLLDAVRGGRAPVVINPDDRAAGVLHAGNEPLLDSRVLAQRPVTIEMILRDVEQNSDRGVERGREIDLVGRAFDHVHAPCSRRLERKDGGADIAADLDIVVGAIEQVARRAQSSSTCRWCR